jgi:hypothetical protein
MGTKLHITFSATRMRIFQLRSFVLEMIKRISGNSGRL